MTTLVRFLIIAVILYGVKACNGEKSQELPNIIFYLADDQDIYDYGCYGNEKVTTPAVDRLAREGMMFSNFFTGQAICAPSRSQLYTGKYPLRNGCFLNHVNTRPDQKSVTHYLRDAGYEVILAGKSHVGPVEVYQWDRFWKSVKIHGKPRKYLPLDSIQSYFIKADKPFCLFITSEYPHGPFFKVEDAETENLEFHPFDMDKQGDQDYLRRKAGYYRNIEEDNKQLEKVLEWVDTYLGKNTLFIYSADHGKSGKFTLYDRGLNVPFVARWPEVIEMNSRSDVLIHYTDVLPTFLEIAGIEVPAEMDGTSFFDVLKGGDDEIHSHIYGVQTNQNIQQCAVFPARMIRTHHYKYIRNFNSVEVVENNLGDNQMVNQFIMLGAEKFKDVPFEELYDLRNDPFEQINLAREPAYQEIKDELIKELYHWMNQQEDFLVEKGQMPLLKPTLWYLDRNSRHRTIPEELVNTLTEADYMQFHY